MARYKRRNKARSLKASGRRKRTRMDWAVEVWAGRMKVILLVLLALVVIAYGAAFGVSAYNGVVTGNPFVMAETIMGMMNKEENLNTPLPEATVESQTQPVTEAPTETRTEAPTETETETPEETTTEAPTEKLENLAVIYVDADVPVKLRSDAYIPTGDKDANILAEVSSAEKLTVQVIKKNAGESNGYKWSKVRLIKTLKNSDNVTVKNDKGKLKKGTVCYVVSNYLVMEED